MLGLRPLVLGVVAVAIPLLLGGCPAGPQDAARTNPPPDQATAPSAGSGSDLTKEQVRNFMRTMEDTQVDSAMRRIAEAAGVATMDDTVAVPNVLEAASRDPEFDELVQAHGFSSAREWVETARIVLPAMGHAAAAAMAGAQGVKEGSEEFERMRKDSEFEAAEAFPEPTPDQQRLVDEVVAEKFAEQAQKDGAR